MTARAGQDRGSWRAFRLIPDDVLFFRDGRPASRGDDHYHRSVFPPHPSTVYGAVRTRRLLDEGVDLGSLGPGRREAWKALPAGLREELGDWGGHGTLELRGPWLVRGDDEVLVPAPADLGLTLRSADRLEGDARPSPTPAPPEVERVARFLVHPEDRRLPGGHSHPLEPLHPFEWTGEGWKPWAPAEIPPRPPAGWFLTPEGFRRWSEGLAPEPQDLVHESALWRPEPRVGVAMEDDERAGRSGHLFTFGFVRLAPRVALGFEVRGAGLQAGRRLRLGGEGRTCWLADGPGLPATAAGAGSSLRVVLATPTVSEAGGWFPGFSADERSGSVRDRRVRLDAAAVPGYTLIGGWDLARGVPKPLRRALPAGSVASLAQLDSSDPLPPTHIHGSNLAGYSRDSLDRQGFGLALVGAEPHVTP